MNFLKKIYAACFVSICLAAFIGAPAFASGTVEVIALEKNTNTSKAAAKAEETGELSVADPAAKLLVFDDLKTSEVNASGEKMSATQEIWLRLKSRFKTSEIELHRKKYARAALEETGEVEDALTEEISLAGDTSEALLSGEVKLNKKGRKKNATSEVGLKAKNIPDDFIEKPKTAEVKIESGLNLFERHCFSCHFDHEHFKYAKNLSGKEFWLKYKDGDEDIKKIIRNGFRTVEGDMPFHDSERLSEKEVAAIIEHLKSITQPLKIEKK